MPKKKSQDKKPRQVNHIEMVVPGGAIVRVPEANVQTRLSAGWTLAESKKDD